jgi:hypothetical protein
MIKHRAEIARVKPVQGSEIEPVQLQLPEVAKLLTGELRPPE